MDKALVPTRPGRNGGRPLTGHRKAKGQPPSALRVISPVALLRRRSTNPDRDPDRADRPRKVEDCGHEGEVAGRRWRNLEVVGFSGP